MKSEKNQVATIILIIKILTLILVVCLDDTKPVEYVASPEIYTFAQHAEASTEMTMTDEELCSLNAVVCDNEEPVEKALQEIPHKTAKTAELIKYLYDYAEGTDVDPEIVSRTIYCESMWYNIKSGYINDQGIQEESYGLAQIHLPSHPHITKDQALDPYFALRFIVDHWHTVKWYGYDREHEVCTNPIKGYWID